MSMIRDYNNNEKIKKNAYMYKRIVQQHNTKKCS